MPGRLIPLINNEYYHVINRGVANLPTFLDKRDYQRGLETMKYYQKQEIPIRYSLFLKLDSEQKLNLLKDLKLSKNLVDIVAFCFMPNHLHFLLRQVSDQGIANFMSNFSNSYTKYFNIKRQRAGHLFQGRFKAVRVNTEGQLLHLSRYIHLNPLSIRVVKSFEELKKYPYSSLAAYLGTRYQDFVCQIPISNSFSREHSGYESFLSDRVDFQQELEAIKHLLLEK